MHLRLLNLRWVSDQSSDTASNLGDTYMQKTVFETGSTETDRKPQVSRNVSSKDERLFDNGDIVFARVLSVEPLEPNFCISEIPFRDPKDISDFRKSVVLGDGRIPLRVQFVAVILNLFA